MSTRTLNWFETQADATAIVANKWNFHIAKAVATNSATPSYNVVWQSQAFAPSTQISWKNQYALAWTADVPSEGVAVKIRGGWQKCDKGEAYDINPLGFWDVSKKAAGEPGWLKVGNIDYSYPGVLGIHIVVGVLNARTGKYEPIFVDETTLPWGSQGKYQPQETVSWWLEASDQSGQVFHSTKSRASTYDFSNPSDALTNSYEWSTSFVMIGGKWTIAAGSPPQTLTAPPPSAQLAALSIGGEAPVELQLDYASWLIVFAVPLAAKALGAIGAALQEKLKNTFRKININIVGTDGTTLRIDYEAGGNGAPGTVEYLGTPLAAGGGPIATIDGALKGLKDSKQIPDNETWNIVPSTNPYSVTSPDSSTFSPPANAQAAPNLKGGYLGYQQQQHQQQGLAKSPFSQGYSNGVTA
ncbi:hypothetical protein B0H63DRAFT_390298 [Podospora didyma]|uniref:Uncharacterized protein n=1 Tax=Podospora didyma TaxID=330526 RepID=A0AAE0NYE7_9PEZI|nr:hypothetical protein B0H63DRAFT_390298 [Podospora didyma]